MPSAPFVELCQTARDIGTLNSVSSLLNWDQETYMPPAAADHRAEQASMLASLVHERRTNKHVGDLIATCETDKSIIADPSSAAAAAVREFRRDFELATKLPGDLVAELARVGSQAQEVWKDARQKSDFKLFAPWLEKMIALVRKKADCYGVAKGGERYDALLNEYEPGATAREIETIRETRYGLRKPSRRKNVWRYGTVVATGGKSSFRYLPGGLVGGQTCEHGLQRPA